MTNDEKAKAYDEALERAKEFHHPQSTTIRGIIEEIFPELRESEGEDERIRKKLYNTVMGTPNDSTWFDGTSKEAMLAWLEKQKEQKEQKPAEWSEFDKGALKDAICATDILGNDESFNKGNPNLGKAFRVAKDWLKSLPERLNLQPKQEWSEEDEYMFEKIDGSLNGLQMYINEHPSMSEGYKESVIKDIKKQQDFLKSLRPPQYCENCKLKKSVQGWKPSEEQMRALYEAAREAPFDRECGNALYGLYDQLQKL